MDAIGLISWSKYIMAAMGYTHEDVSRRIEHGLGQDYGVGCVIAALRYTSQDVSRRAERGVGCGSTRHSLAQYRTTGLLDDMIGARQYTPEDTSRRVARGPGCGSTRRSPARTNSRWPSLWLPHHQLQHRPPSVD